MVHGDGKVLPVGVVDWNRVDLVVASAEDFEACLVRSRCADDGTSFEVELVSGVITGFMPNILQQKKSESLPLEMTLKSMLLPSTRGSSSSP